MPHFAAYAPIRKMQWAVNMENTKVFKIGSAVRNYLKTINEQAWETK